MQIKRTKVENYAVISLTGDMDAYDAEAFDGVVNEVINSGDRDVIVDFSGLKYISSSGLRALITLRKQVLKKGGKLGLVSLSDKVLEVFKVSKLLGIFDVYNSMEDALKK